ncbi:MAG: hypothetical protein ACI8ZW_001338, partial [Yoonia sp.]
MYHLANDPNRTRINLPLKLELNMRSAYYRKESRCDGHLFITVLAYPIRRCKSSAA